MADEPTTPPVVAPEKTTDPPTPEPARAPEPPIQEATPTPAPPALEPETVKATKNPKCPHCGDGLEVYAGAALHKLATAFCHRCGLRHHLKG